MTYETIGAGKQLNRIAAADVIGGLDRGSQSYVPGLIEARRQVHGIRIKKTIDEKYGWC